MSNPFQASKNYSKLNFVEAQLPVPSDVNHACSLNEYQSEYTSKYSLGFQLTIHHMTNSPVLKTRPNFDLTEGQVLTLEMTAINMVKWKKNAGGWSAPIAVTNDGETWNTVGTSGVDAIFPTTTAGADVSEVWVAQGMRLLGGNMFDTAVGNELEVEEGHWSLCGRYVELPDKLIAGIANNDYLYFKDTVSTVDYLTDPDIGHRLVSGAYAPIAPTATKHTYTAMSGAIFPDNTSISKYIILGKATVAGIIVTPTFMWVSPYDLQKVVRDYGDTEKPAIPTGLATDTGSELEFQITGTPAMSTPLPLAYLEMSCNPNTEPDLAFYEFKVMKLAIDGVTATTDIQTYAVYPNIDAGGMGIPTGIMHVIHNQLAGTKFKVWVRAYDKSGNISDWSASVSQEVGGVCAIGGAVAAPDITLTNIDGFPGFGITIDTGGTWPAGGFGYRVWIADGAYPNIAINEGLEKDHLKAESTLRIPFTEMSYPHVRVKCFDNSGLLQTLHSEDSLNVAITLESGISSHNMSVASHGGSIADVIQCQTPFGSMYRWFTSLSQNAWTPGNVYILAESGSSYTTLDSCLTAIELDGCTRATIFVMPGSYGAGGVLNFPSINCRISIIGLGNNTCNFGDSIDLSNVWGLASAASPKVLFQNINFYLDVTGDNTGTGRNVVSFINCCFKLVGGTRCLDFDSTGAGSWFLRFRTCKFYGDAVNLIQFKDDIDFIFDNCTIIQLGAAQIAFYLDIPTSSVRLLKNTAIQVSGVTTGQSIDADGGGPYNVWVHGTSYNKAPSVRVTIQAGTVNTNTVIASDYIDA